MPSEERLPWKAGVPLQMNPFSLAASFTSAKGNLEEMQGGRDCLLPVCQLIGNAKKSWADQGMSY